jgi:hypothetical protein
MPGLGGVVDGGLRRQEPLGDPRDRRREKDKDESKRHVEREVEQHDLLCRPEPQRADWLLDVRDEGHEEDATDQLEQEVAERDPARLGRRIQRGQHPEKAAAEIGAEHEAERDGERDHVQRSEGGHQEHDGEARVAQDRHQRGDQHVEQHVAGKGREEHLDAGGLDHGLGGDRDPLQREHDEAEADHHAPELPDYVLLAGEEKHDADEDQERRQPGQVERQHDRHDRGADVGAEHHGQRRRSPDEALAGECRDDERGGRTALDQGGDAQSSEKRRETVADALAQHAAQVAAVEAQDPGAHDMRAPDEQRHAGQQVE